MSYEATVCKLSKLSKVQGLDNLLVADIYGYPVLVSPDHKEGDPGVFFQVGSALSHEYCFANCLYRHAELNKDPQAKPGFFEDNRKVRTLKLRKVPSEGFWMPLESLSFTGADLSTLKEGDTFKELVGIPICKRFYSRQAQSLLKKEGKQKKKAIKSYDYSLFLKHFETGQLRLNMRRIREGMNCILSLKCHGTSARTGYLPVFKNLSPLQLWLKLYFGLLFFWLQRSMQWVYVSGTRNVVMDPVELTGDTYYSDTKFRAKIHEQIKAKGLHKGETLYYEIVGYTDTGAQIMPSHHVEDKELIKKYGDTMTYKYGCDPVLKPWRVLLYRITLTNEDGYVLEYSWDMVRARAKELDLEVVPELTRFIAPNRDTQDFILNIVRPLSDGPDLLDPSHIREGVCLRVEDPNNPNDVEIFKWKNFNFCQLENIRSNEDAMLDEEEIQSLKENNEDNTL